MPDAGMIGDDKLAALLARYDSATTAVVEHIRAMVASAEHIGQSTDQFFAWAVSGKSGSHGLVVLGGLLLIAAIGLAAETIYGRAVGLSSYRARLPARDTLSERLRILLPTLLLDFLSVLIFQAGALAAFFALHQGHQPTRHIFLAYLTAFVVVRLLAAAGRMIFAPDQPSLRALPVSTTASRWLQRELVFAGAVAAFGFATATLFRLAGLPSVVVNLLLLAPYTIFFVAVIAMILTLRSGLYRSDVPQPSHRWPAIAVIYVVFIFFIGQFAAYAGQSGVIFSILGSLALGALIPLIDALLRGTLAGQQGATDYRPRGVAGGCVGTVLVGAKSFARALLYAAGAIVLARIWGIDPLKIAEAGFGGFVAQAVMEIILTIVLAVAAWEIVKAAVDGRIASEAPVATPGQGDGEGGGTGASRIATLLPLLRKFLLATILIVASMMALSSVGINIGPLLAGVGVVGLAIGFGAQTLVRDIVSGVFFLLDDAFRVGEYIEIGEHRGRVERISIRSLRLRHHRGPLLTIPFGEIKTLTNHSRDWAIIKLSFRLSFGTDPAKVKKIVKRVSAELLAHPEYGSKFIEPLKSQGVRGMDETGILIGVKFMARPGEQFQLRRESYQRLLAALEAEGIALARPQVIVQMPQDSKMDEAQRAALQSGAAAALRPRTLDDGSRAAS